MTIFLTKRPTHSSFFFLSAWFGVIAIFLGSFLLPFEVVAYFKPGIFPLLFLLGPLLYLYVSSLTVETFQLTKRDFFHFVPLVIISLHRSAVVAVPILSPADDPLFRYNKVYYFLLLVTLSTYWMFTLTRILKYRRNIPLHFSNYTRTNSLTWLIFVLSFFLFFFLADFVRYFLKIALAIEWTTFSMLPLNLTAFVFIMTFFGINQSAIYRPVPKKPLVGEEAGSETANSRPTLLSEEVNDLNEDIVDYLKSKKPYLNPEFNLEMMASDLGISKHKLSQLINVGQNKNFYKLINEYRIAEVKAMLIHPSYGHFSVLGVAFECGFNSKSAFNRIFKEETGLTPSEYKRTS